MAKKKKSDIRQQEILAYMRDVIREKGFPPTVREICAALSIPSTSTVHNDLRALQAQGFIKKDPSKPRALALLDPAGAADASSAAAQSAGFTPASFSDIDTVELPLVGRVAAGTPILAEQNIEDSIPFPARFIGRGTNFLLVVHGESMVDIGINDGYYLIVQEGPEAHNGDIVVAMIDGEYESEATVKRFYREDGHIRLQPENAHMDPIIVDDCRIVGQVRGVFRYFA